MSKFDNTKDESYWPFTVPKGFSFGWPVTPHNYLVQQFLCNYHPYLKDIVKKIMKEEEKEIVNEKVYSLEDLKKDIERMVKNYEEKNAIKNSVLFNMDYAKAEESLKKAFEDPEMVKRFRENISGIFAHRNPKTNVFGDLMWGIGKEVMKDKKRREKKEDGPRLIFEYIKKKKRGTVGLLVGFKPVESSIFYVGYSLCNPKDEFDLFTAFQLAFHSMFRIQTFKNTPQSIKAQKRRFVDRCSSYFKSLRGNFLYVTHKDKFWMDFCACIPAEVRKNLEASPLDYKHFVLTPKKKEAPENVMYANRVDFENVFDEQEYHCGDLNREFMYKNIRFGGCTHEKPNSRCIKITWEFME